MAYGISERRACLATGFGRSSQRYRTRADPQVALRMRLQKLAAARVCYATLARSIEAPVASAVMDNLGSHKGPAVREAIEAAGTRLLFLPPYSPDFNPIEMAVSRLKALLRKATARTVEGLWTTIGRLIDTATPDECANFFAVTGYDPD